MFVGLLLTYIGLSWLTYYSRVLFTNPSVKRSLHPSIYIGANNSLSNTLCVLRESVESYRRTSVNFWSAVSVNNKQGMCLIASCISAHHVLGLRVVHADHRYLCRIWYIYITYISETLYAQRHILVVMCI